MGVDKELLKKYHLEEAQKRFQQITEYTFITKPLLDEDDDETGNDTPQTDQDDGMNDQSRQRSNDNQTDNMGGAMPDNQQPPMNGDVTQDSGQNGIDTDSLNEPIGDNGGNISTDDNVDTMQPDDEVIDVDELTKAQETTDVKIDGVDDKLQNMLSVMNKFIAAIDNNDKKIDDLRAEFEKRNPSEEEKINIRSQASAPYSETPKDYWDKKSQDSNYNVIYNNDVDPDKEEKEYIIKKGDLNGMDDRSLAKSLDYPTKLENFINF